MITIKRQTKSLFTYPARQFKFWRGMIGARKRNGFWALEWDDGDVTEVTFEVIRMLSPRLECFIVNLNCGCTRWIWGPLRTRRGRCVKHKFRIKERGK